MSILQRPRDKFELRDYLREIELGNPQKLETLAEEIIGNVFEVMDKYRQLPAEHPLRKYYEPPLTDIELAYSSKDFKKSFPQAINHLIISINWE